MLGTAAAVGVGCGDGGADEIGMDDRVFIAIPPRFRCGTAWRDERDTFLGLGFRHALFIISSISRRTSSAERQLDASRAELAMLPGGVLLVTAHPDDECMFFTPVILHLIDRGLRVALLCLSTGAQ